MAKHPIPLSILDLIPIRENSTIAASYDESIALAQQAEQWGYQRYWLAEHHNMTGIGSSATALLLGQIGAKTDKIRIGSGGIMLPNHSPLVVAEQFGTLETLFPGRVDLGLGRAPGSDMATARALGRTLDDGEAFPQMLEQLEGYFATPTPYQQVRAVPGAGLDVPLWLLGSSGFSAQLAAKKGLPFAFAGQFAPRFMLEALALYRDNFRPSAVLDKPYVMIGTNIYVAETTPEAQRLATSHQQMFLGLIRGTPGRLPAPVDDMDKLWSAQEKATVHSNLSASIVGDPATVHGELTELAELTGADEFIINAAIYDPAARQRSYQLLADCWLNNHC